MPWDKFEHVRYIIHDGKRLGGSFTDDYAVVLPGLVDGYDSADYWGDCDGFWDWSGQSKNPGYTLAPDATPQCTLLWNVAVYGIQSGFLGLNKSSSVFNDSGTLIK